MARLASSPAETFARRIAYRDPSLRLYAILDAETCARRGLSIATVAEAWRDAGIRLVQYRDKQGSDADVLRNAEVIRTIFDSTDALLILNDRVQLLLETGFHGVHVGQTDLSPAQSRQRIGADAILGVSTHTAQQAAAADGQPVDYVAVGPVFGTTTKTDAEPVIGLEGVHAFRPLTSKPLVAIGGITKTSAPDVFFAGADSVAVISALLPSSDVPTDEAAAAFLRLLG
jgi:thiamine-phosphate pyrophosphorylase